MRRYERTEETAPGRQRPDAPFRRRGRWLRRVAHIIVVVVALCLAAIVACVLYLAVRRGAPVALPRPTGPYGVGRVEYDWVDPTRADPFAPTRTRGSKRELAVWVWYPATPAPGSAPAPYLPAAWADAREADRGAWALLYQRIGAVRAHAVAHAPVAPAPRRFPVVIFEPGLGSLPTDYTTLLEDLASHGYVVVGITPTDSAAVVVFPDGRMVPSVDAAREPTVQGGALDALTLLWARDVRFVLDRLHTLAGDAGDPLAGHLDLARIAVFGHSFGGAAAAEACRADHRCQAVIDIDGDPFGAVARVGLRQPVLFLMGDDFWAGSCDALCRQARRGVATIYASAGPSAGHYEATIRGTRHFNFMDYAVLFDPLDKPAGLRGSIDGGRGLTITRAYVRAFFDAYLKHAAATLLTGTASAYPEVVSKAH